MMNFGERFCLSHKLFYLYDALSVLGIDSSLKCIAQLLGIIYNTSMDHCTVVIDTNVLLSGLKSSKGLSFKLLSILPSQKFDIAISVPLILEYESILKKHLCPQKFSDKQIDDVINFMCKIGKNTKIYYLWRPFLKDPFDDHILEVAVSSSSQYIVTYNLTDFINTEKFFIKAITPLDLLKNIGEIV